MGKFGIGVMNDNRERLCDFCSAKESNLPSERHL